MIYLFRKLRKAIATLRSETSPHELALGATFGVLLGFPPVGIHMLLPLIPILLFRNAIGTVLLFALLARLLAWPLAQLSFDTGVALLRDSDALRGFMTWVTNAPFFGLMGLDRYYVFGSFALALPLAVGAYFLVRIFILKFRSQVVHRVGASDKVQKHAEKFWFKAGRWLFLGGKVKQVKQPTGIWRFFRKATVIGLPIILILFTVAGVLAVQFGLGSAVASAVGSASGAPTSVASSWANPLSQRVSLGGLVVEDPKAEDDPTLHISDMHLDVDMLAMMSGRMRVPELKVSGIKMRLVRRPDGSLAIAEAPAVTGRPSGSEEPPTEAEEDYLEWVRGQAKDADWLEIASKTAEFVRERMAENRAEEAEEATHGLPFDPFAREIYESGEPLIRLDLVAIEDFSIEIEDQRPGHEEKLPVFRTSFKLENLSSNRMLRGEDWVAEILANIGGEENGSFTLDGKWLAPGSGSEDGDLTAALNLNEVDLPALAALFDTTIPIGVEQGRLSFASGITLRDGQIAPSTGELRFDELHLAQPKAGQTFLGLDAEASRWFIDGLNAVAAEEPLEMTAFVDGPMEQPNVHVEANLLAIAKRGVEKLALQRGRAEAERILGQLDGALQEQLGELGALGDGLGGEAAAALQRDVLGPLLEGDPSKIDTSKITEGLQDSAKDAGEKAAGDLLEGALEGTGLEKQGGDLLKGAIPGLGPKKGEKKEGGGETKDPLSEAVKGGLGGLFGGGEEKEEKKKKKDGENKKKNDPKKKDRKKKKNNKEGGGG